MENTTLHKILNVVQAAAESHAQVNSYNFGEVSDISASEQEQYPLVWVDVVNALVVEKTLQVVLKFLVLDVQKDDMTNEQDTLNDTLEIALDIYALLTNPTNRDNFTIPYNLQLDTIREGLPDKVNGWQSTITIEAQNVRNRCQVPQRT